MGNRALVRPWYTRVSATLPLKAKALNVFAFPALSANSAGEGG